jgi:hypothetical protein
MRTIQDNDNKKEYGRENEREEQIWGEGGRLCLIVAYVNSASRLAEK